MKKSFFGITAIVCLIIFLLALDLQTHAQNMGGSNRSSGKAGGNSVSSYAGGAMGDAVIKFDQETGSLIIITDDETNKHIEKIIRSIDKPVSQVLIKVLFLEVTHTSGFDIGVEGSYTYGSEGSEDTLQTIFGLARETRGGFYKILDEDLEITLRAIAETSKLEVLSRPSVLVKNNEEATITVGQEVPFIRNSRITDNGDTINTIEYEDIGIILNVTPHITEDRLVEMLVLPEISTLTGETVAISETVNARVIAKRSAETIVVVEDGKTVVIGGMMEDNVTETVTKIPILGDIPLIGMAFKRTVREKSKTELMIFLTPHVVESSSELKDLSVAESNKAEITHEVYTDKQIDRYDGYVH
jgi:general secretion pathway protein D